MNHYLNQKYFRRSLLLGPSIFIIVEVFGVNLVNDDNNWTQHETYLTEAYFSFRLYLYADAVCSRLFVYY